MFAGRGYVANHRNAGHIQHRLVIIFLNLHYIYFLHNLQHHLIRISCGLEISSKNGRKLGPCLMLQSYKLGPHHGQD